MTPTVILVAVTVAVGLLALMRRPDRLLRLVAALAAAYLGVFVGVGWALAFLSALLALRLLRQLRRLRNKRKRRRKRKAPRIVPRGAGNAHVYICWLEHDYIVSGRVLAVAGDPGYIGRTSSADPQDRWARPDHPLRQEWGRAWLSEQVTVYTCASEEDSVELERQLIVEHVAAGGRLFNIEHVPPAHRLARVA